MHIFDPRFAPSPHWKKQPPVADVALYRQLQERLGTQRTVVVTPSTYGVDNSCTLDARRVRGLRVNFVTPQSWGTTTPGMLEALARKAAAFEGWHVQVFMHPEQMVDMEPLLASLPVPLVIDHLGRIDPADGATGAAFDAMRRLLDAGNTWVKLSGVYMRSRKGAPGYEDTFALGRALVAHAPQRLVWGSDWPHTTELAGSVEDADLLDVLAAWCDSDESWSRVLVHNPARLYGFD
jgi:predicted TIM-barrel fold metal-dependent hydrolase